MSGLLGGNSPKLGYLFALIIVLVVIVAGSYGGWYFSTSEDGKLSEWSDCDKKCGGGTQTRTYRPPTHNGKDLPDKNILTQSCNTQHCPIDGTYNNWSDYGTCVKSETDNIPITCGTGKKSRTRTYNAPQYNGVDNPDYQGNDKTPLENKLIEWSDCTHSTIPNCPINGNYSNWVNEGECVKSSTDNTAITCGDGVQKRIRIYTQPQYGGIHHPDYTPGKTDLENKLIDWTQTCQKSRLCQPINESCSAWIDDGRPDRLGKKILKGMIVEDGEMMMK